VIRSVFAASAGSTLGGGHWPDDPPTGDPSGLTFYVVSEDTGEIGIEWVNGDLAAWTEIAFSPDGEPVLGELVMMTAPGVTRWNTGTTSSVGWWVRHTRGGTPGDWVGPTA
jgi:hypothetical protein